MASEHEIRPGARVIGGHGEKLGTIESLLHNAEDGSVSGFVIEHGIWPFKKQKLLSVEAIRQVNNNPDTVVVDFDKREFRGIPPLGSV